MSANDTHAGIPRHEMTSEWADLSAVPRVESSWAHSGLVATSSGELIGFHAGQLVAFDKEGRVQRVVNQELTEGHGITLVREGDDEYLWISDPGFVFQYTADVADDSMAPMFGKGLRHVGGEPRVVKVTLAGEVCLALPIPSFDSGYGPGQMGPYCPCGTSIDEERFGGSGDVWVADGYGSSLVHRFDKLGRHVFTLSGDEGGGRFNCPHAVYIDRRNNKSPELYIADRGNKRVQVYDLEGRYLRTFGEDFLNSPSGFAQWGDVLVVAELFRGSWPSILRITSLVTLAQIKICMQTKVGPIGRRGRILSDRGRAGAATSRTSVQRVQLPPFDGRRCRRKPLRLGMADWRSVHEVDGPALLAQLTDIQSVSLFKKGGYDDTAR